MRRTMCKSKIHRATLTGADLQYEGSLTLDRDLMDAADILPFEKVHVVNLNTGSRLETYVIEGESGSGTIQLNGAAARLGAAGDHVIVISYADYEEQELSDFEPRIVFVDERNRIRETTGTAEGAEPAEHTTRSEMSIQKQGPNGPLRTGLP